LAYVERRVERALKRLDGLEELAEVALAEAAAAAALDHAPATAGCLLEAADALDDL
jgi:hypothetical protein